MQASFFIVIMNNISKKKGFLYHKLAEKTLYHLTFIKKRSKLGGGVYRIFRSL